MTVEWAVTFCANRNSFLSGVTLRSQMDYWHQNVLLTRTTLQHLVECKSFKYLANKVICRQYLHSFLLRQFSMATSVLQFTVYYSSPLYLCSFVDLFSDMHWSPDIFLKFCGGAVGIHCSGPFWNISCKASHKMENVWVSQCENRVRNIVTFTVGGGGGACWWNL